MIYINGIIIFIINMFINTNIHPYFNKTFVYCASRYDNNWFWLKDEYGKYQALSGEWKIKTLCGFKFSYFLIKNPSLHKVNKLVQMCTNSYGDDYDIIQPADTIFFKGWYPFAITDDKYLEGKIDIIFHHDKYNSNIKYNYTYDNRKNLNKILTPLKDIKKSIYIYYTTKIKNNIFINNDKCFEDNNKY